MWTLLYTIRSFFEIPTDSYLLYPPVLKGRQMAQTFSNTKCQCHSPNMLCIRNICAYVVFLVSLCSRLGCLEKVWQMFACYCTGKAVTILYLNFKICRLYIALWREEIFEQFTIFVTQCEWEKWCGYFKWDKILLFPYIFVWDL